MKKFLSVVLTLLLFCNVLYSFTLEIVGVKFLEFKNESLSSYENVTTFSLNLLHFKMTVTLNLDELNVFARIWKEVHEQLNLINIE